MWAELFPRVGFIVNNLTHPNRAVMRSHNKRGTAEMWIKEGQQAVQRRRLSCHRFRYSLQQRLVKRGARLVKHARYYLVAFGGGSSDEAVVCEHVGADSGVPAPTG
jgi:hypothetical protein